MAKLIGWAFASLGFAMSILLVAMSIRIGFAKAASVEVDFRVTAVGSASAKVSLKD